MNKLLLSFLLVSIVGCTPTVKIVRIPVPVQPPVPELPQKPYLLTKDMDATTPHPDFVKAMQIDYLQLLGYSSALENLLKVYQKDINKLQTEEIEKEIVIKP